MSSAVICTLATSQLIATKSSCPHSGTSGASGYTPVTDFPPGSTSRVDQTRRKPVSRFYFGIAQGPPFFFFRNDVGS
ncbi:hypothetical protein PAXRUDRAFT_827967 [Paxillus rubicundulus Ve08.2h10]|uniref:Uncharacterized protein n=1 Tax=Paxillus rubicundulus Ve08.2h10 TaxID=930991 RepID=A0A0D0DQA0_9AGAM|nr:hypothetical protein PAXRUDRAFT_827967 [Paxillus rubicundulus Ve08.2h10]